MCADERLRALSPDLRERLVQLGIICDAQLLEWEQADLPAPEGPTEADLARWCGLVVARPSTYAAGSMDGGSDAD